jgi:uncharacterized protein
MTTLDSRAPYVLDTHELGRRPGTSLRVHRMLPAPEGLVVGLASVPSDAELSVDLQLEAVMEGVFVTARTSAPVVAECARCLAPIERDLDVTAQELVAYPADDLDADAFVMDGDLLDLEPILRDAVALSLPGTMICRDDCPGLCPDCGAALADEPDHSHDDSIDPRWAALRDLTDGADAAPTDDSPEEN